MIVLHVGAGKCGSSALQRYLSLNPEIKLNNGKNIFYYAVNKKGIFSGDKVKSRAEESIHGYMSSQAVRTIAKIDNSEVFKNFSDEDIHVLSAEAWIREVKLDEMQLFIKQFNQPVVILMYVRPQVPLLNSAYWQWGAWSDKNPRNWIINYAKNSAKWHSKYKNFIELENVSECKVRILSGDIISDFLSLFGDGVDNKSDNMTNKSLSGDLLRVMQRNRQLRPNENASLIDFVFEKYFPDIGGKTPWVIDEKLMSTIINECRSDNKMLLKILDEDQAKLMKDDERWWKNYSIASKIESPDPLPVKDKTCEDILVRSIEIIMDKVINRPLS